MFHPVPYGRQASPPCAKTCLTADTEPHSQRRSAVRKPPPRLAPRASQRTAVRASRRSLRQAFRILATSTYMLPNSPDFPRPTDSRHEGSRQPRPTFSAAVLGRLRRLRKSRVRRMFWIYRGQTKVNGGGDGPDIQPSPGFIRVAMTEQAMIAEDPQIARS